MNKIKKILMGAVAVLTVVVGVAVMSAFEAHVINVTAKIENALSVSSETIEFGNVFPQEYFEEKIGIGLSDSFLYEQERVKTVEYKILQKPKPCPEGNPECGPDGYYRDLCKFLSKIDDQDPKNDVASPSYYVVPSVGEPYCQDSGIETRGALAKIYDTYDWWKIDLKVPPVSGSIGQDWPESCSDYVVPLDGATYGCDLWVEVKDISSAAGIWYFDEGIGNTTYDSSDNGNHGTINGATWVPGKYNTALSFDGVDDYVQVPDSDSLDLTSDFTYELWVKRNTFGTIQDLLSKNGPQTTGAPTLYFDSSNKVSFVVQNIAVVGTSNTAITDTAWHHIALVRNSSENTYKFYIDGVLDNTIISSTSPTANNRNLGIGAEPPGTTWPFNGTIDEVRILNIAKTF